MQGIYEISANDILYIGSSIDIEKRWSQHINDLKYGTHHSRYMQRVYNKYGIEVFKFRVIETVDNIDDLLAREQYWLDWLFGNHDSKQVFNSSRIAGRVTWTDEMRIDLGKKVRAAITPEERQRRTQRNIERNQIQYMHSPEARKKSVESRLARLNQSISLRAPDGTLYENITNLTAFAKEHGLYAHALRGVLNGTNFHAHGWTLPENRFPTYAFVSPDGEVFDNIVSLKAFSEEHGLEYKNMHSVWKGIRKSHKGWKRLVQTEEMQYF